MSVKIKITVLLCEIRPLNVWQNILSTILITMIIVVITMIIVLITMIIVVITMIIVVRLQ